MLRTIKFSVITILSLVQSVTSFSSPSATSPVKSDPIPNPDTLINRAKEILSPSIQVGTKDGGACLAEDFEFCAAFVGPISKAEFLAALESFNIEEAFDITPNFFGFHVDPVQTNRVWYMNRSKGIHTGTCLGKEATGKELTLPPEIFHLDFKEDGLVKEFGFYTADRRQGNTGGLGGVFGYFYGIGRPLPIPEAKPYRRSLRFRFLNFMSRLGTKLSGSKKQ